jgi:hypothetical protein
VLAHELHADQHTADALISGTVTTAATAVMLPALQSQQVVAPALTA